MADLPSRHVAPILDHPTDEQAVFLPENLLERAAIVQGKARGSIPRCCLLDFDAELVPVARARFGAKVTDGWSCFHTTLLNIERDGLQMGLIGGTVGAPYAVLVAEELIASGCRHIIAYSSAGAIAEWLRVPCLVVPEGALRDEGTSYHYLPPARWAVAHGALPDILGRRAEACGLPVHRGLSWTTDAPYRETQSQIARHRAEGVLCVEMEAAALMGLAQARGVGIASLLHVTNVLATGANDFHKGPEDIHERVIGSCLDSFADALGVPQGGAAGT
ncbi:MAG: nucleoside phosphorylase [Chloroflexota bacterium]